MYLDLFSSLTPIKIVGLGMATIPFLYAGIHIYKTLCAIVPDLNIAEQVKHIFKPNKRELLQKKIRNSLRQAASSVNSNNDEFPLLKSKSMMLLKDDGFILSKAVRNKICQNPDFYSNKKFILENNKIGKIVHSPEGENIYLMLLDNKIGSGFHASVYLGQNLKTGRWVAMKEHTYIGRVSEYARLKECKKFLDFSELIDFLYIGNKLIMVTPCYHNNEIKNKNINDKINYSLHLIEKIALMHKRNILFNDLHSGNILWSQNKKSIEIVDFGSCSKSDKLSEKFLHFPKRKPNCEPPEFYPFGFNAKSGDVYALGLILNKLFKGYTLQKELKDLFHHMTHSFSFMRPDIEIVLKLFKENCRSENFVTESKKVLSHEAQCAIKECREKEEKYLKQIKLSQNPYELATLTRLVALYEKLEDSLLLEECSSNEEIITPYFNRFTRKFDKLNRYAQAHQLVFEASYFYQPNATSSEKKDKEQKSFKQLRSKKDLPRLN